MKSLIVFLENDNHSMKEIVPNPSAIELKRAVEMYCRAGWYQVSAEYVSAVSTHITVLARRAE